MLLGAVVIYRLLDGPDFIGVLGPIHGLHFLVYYWLVKRNRDSQGWGFWRTVGVLVAPAIPLGGFWAADHRSVGTPGQLQNKRCAALSVVTPSVRRVRPRGPGIGLR
jgi:integral membrane protein